LIRALSLELVRPGVRREIRGGVHQGLVG
jgi:hypothetical protein